MANEIYKIKVGTSGSEIDYPVRDNRILTLTDASTTAGTWVATAPNLTAYTDGQLFLYTLVKAGGSETTLNINSIGAKPVYRQGTTRLTTHFAVGCTLLLVYNVTNDCFRVVNFYDANTTYSAGTGLSLSGTTINHSNSVTAVGSNSFLKFKYDAQGHVTGSTAVTKTDITNLGIPSSDTNTAHAHSYGVGLIGSGNAGTTGTYTYKAALADETLDTNAAVTRPAANANRIYPVIPDKNGKLAAIVPWTDNDTNTHRPIQVNGTEILGNNTTPLNLKAGSNITLSNSSGTVTITGPTVNNGQLTMQVNGATKTIFTANQSGNSTFNVTAADLGLSSAIKFVGTSSTDPTTTTGATVEGHTTWAKGEMVIYKRSGETYYEEYLNITGSNTSTTTPNPNWELLGDADSYAKKGISTGTSAPGTDSKGSHTHSVTVAAADRTAASAGTHTHIFSSGSAGKAGAHTHAVTGTVASAGSHSHSVTAAGKISVGTGTANYTPGGTNAAPIFTGSSVNSGSALGSHSHSYTPAGTISIGTGTANYTPAGTNAAPIFTGNDGTTGSANLAHTHTITAKGTISTASTGTINYTPAGTVANHSHTIGSASTPIYQITGVGSTPSLTITNKTVVNGISGLGPYLTGIKTAGSASLGGTTTFNTDAIKDIALSASTISTDGPAYLEDVSHTAASLTGDKTFVKSITNWSGGSLGGTTSFNTDAIKDVTLSASTTSTDGPAYLQAASGTFVTSAVGATYSSEVITFFGAPTGNVSTTTRYMKRATTAAGKSSVSFTAATCTITGGSIGISGGGISKTVKYMKHTNTAASKATVTISHSDPAFDSASVAATTISVGSASNWSAGSIPSRSSLTVVTSVNANTGNTQPSFAGTGTILVFSGSSATTESALTTHTHSFKPAGTNTAPTFTGTGTQLLFNGAASNTGNKDLSHTHSVTAAGTNTAPTFTGTGVELVFTGTAVNSVAGGGHTHSIHTDAVATSAGEHTHTVTGTVESAGAHTHTVSVPSVTVTTTEAGSHSHTVNSHSHTQQ